ncbi:MAG: OmpH family outer membrane protein [Planctomycetes bacterium]|nr:OmpH family outer membrane protein [Planctomycetota bacterium]
MKIAGIIIGIVIIGMIGCYSAIIAQDETTPPPKPVDSEQVMPNDVKPSSADTPGTEVKPSSNIGSFPFKVGVVNLAEVFDKYGKFKEFEKILESERKKEDLLRKEILMNIKKLREEIEVLSLGSELYREKSEELAKEQARYEYKTKAWNEYIRNRFNEHAVKMYKDIRDVISKYAVDNGYTFIFKSDPALSAIPQGEDFSVQINIRTILYAPKETDITEDVIKILNK